MERRLKISKLVRGLTTFKEGRVKNQFVLGPHATTIIKLVENLFSIYPRGGDLKINESILSREKFFSENWTAVHHKFKQILVTEKSGKILFLNHPHIFSSRRVVTIKSAENEIMV